MPRAPAKVHFSLPLAWFPRPIGVTRRRACHRWRGWTRASYGVIHFSRKSSAPAPIFDRKRLTKKTKKLLAPANTSAAMLLCQCCHHDTRENLAASSRGEVETWHTSPNLHSVAGEYALRVVFDCVGVCLSSAQSSALLFAGGHKIDPSVRPSVRSCQEAIIRKR